MSQDRKQALQRSREIEDAIRQVLINDWDPIGVADVPEAADEYDSYIGGVYRLLASEADTTSIANHLATIQTEQMGLPQEGQHLKDVARRLQAIDVRLNDQN